MSFYKDKIVHKTKCGTVEATLVDRENGIYKLDSFFWYTVQFKGNECRFEIEPGFYTNFATLPLKIKEFLNPTSKGFLAASTVHDYILNEFKHFQPNLKRTFFLNGENRVLGDYFDWDQAADIFIEIMKAEKAFNFFVRWVILICVKIWARLDPETKHRFLHR
jgi:hypothetical protein